MKIINTLILTTALAASTSHADTLLGADIEVGMWYPDYQSDFISNISGEDSSIFASATIEHGVPSLPNFKVSLSSVKNDTYKYTKIDYTAFYELLDNDLISIDLGMGATQYRDGKYLVSTFTGVLPHTYADAELLIPNTGVTLYTDIHYMNYNSNGVTDVIAGARYDFNLTAVDLGLKAGYRVQSVDVQDLGNLSFDIKTDGYFAALHADF